jgi:hypothetical protein
MNTGITLTHISTFFALLLPVLTICGVLIKIAGVWIDSKMPKPASRPGCDMQAQSLQCALDHAHVKKIQESNEKVVAAMSDQLGKLIEVVRESAVTAERNSEALRTEFRILKIKLGVADE